MSLPEPPRKIPGRHKVKSHKRHAPKTNRIVPIHEYERGHGKVLSGQIGGGKHTQNVLARGVPSYLGSGNPRWEVSFDDAESFNVESPTIVSALDSGFNLRKKDDEIHRVRIVKI